MRSGERGWITMTYLPNTRNKNKTIKISFIRRVYVRHTFCWTESRDFYYPRRETRYYIIEVDEKNETPKAECGLKSYVSSVAPLCALNTRAKVFVFRRQDYTSSPAAILRRCRCIALSPFYTFASNGWSIHCVNVDRNVSASMPIVLCNHVLCHT